MQLLPSYSCSLFVHTNFTYAWPRAHAPFLAHCSDHTTHLRTPSAHSTCATSTPLRWGCCESCGLSAALVRYERDTPAVLLMLLWAPLLACPDPRPSGGSLLPIRSLLLLLRLLLRLLLLLFAVLLLR